MDTTHLIKLQSWSKSHFGAAIYTFRCQENLFFDTSYVVISLPLCYLTYFAYLVEVLNFHMMYQFALICITRDFMIHTS